MAFPPPGTRLHLSLSDGTPVLLRALVPGDQHYLEEGLERLSPRSRQTRFFTALPHLSTEQLRYLTEVDQENHVAWGAVTDDEQTGLGVARFTRLAEDPTTAEVAVTVVDEYQHRGLGSLLLAVLYLIAQRVGVERFRSYVLLENKALVHGLQAIGGIIVHHSEGIAEVELPLVEAALPESPEASHLAEYLDAVRDALRSAGAQPSQNEA